MATENLYQSHWKTNAPSASSAAVGNEKSADSLGRFGSLVDANTVGITRNFSDMKNPVKTKLLH